MLLAGNNKNVFIHPGFYKLIGGAEGIYKTGTLISYIQCTNFFHLHGTLYQNATTREIIIGGYGSENYEIDILWSNAGSFNSDLCSFYSHRCCGFFCAISISSFLYTGTFLYPFITSVHI